MNRSPFLEAIRQIGHDAGAGNRLFLHVTLVPYIQSSGEQKSKPTQHSVRELQSLGIMPDIIVPRCDRPIDPEVLKKIALFCNVKEDCVIENRTLPVLYQAPLMLEQNGLARVVCRELALDCPAPDLREWSAMLDRRPNAVKRCASRSWANTSSCTTPIFLLRGAAPRRLGKRRQD